MDGNYTPEDDEFLMQHARHRSEADDEIDTPIGDCITKVLIWTAVALVASGATAVWAIRKKKEVRS
jgi:hypothetical protein